MSLANKLTVSRLILAPLFFIVYFLPDYIPALSVNGSAWTVPLLWLIAIVSEFTDMFDGIAARKRGEISDFGKFFDPFADTIMQITCFLCFVIDGIFPAILYLLVVYREISILLLRILMMKKGIAMGARLGGKIKTVTYITAGGAALFTVSLERLAILKSLIPYFKIISLVIFIISIIFSLASFFDYLSVYRGTKKTAPQEGQSS
ncbi:MAG: CDP-diacylglycerol--glycerol-3-phosphate 3-phosphatidyltransferase [Treponema sp.]|jgi:CDP-diacylglycerol--glycerol-3-phosphate 3-phosphatidyltransferase|nr:CDP-diacylglycerol--glycerol-3-phosphate 3-phosphatidyltransferase [Treponema sp.]